MIRTTQGPTTIRPSLNVIQDRPTVNRQVPAQQHAPQVLLQQQYVEPEPIQLNPQDGLFTTFLKHVGWGMMEGGLELGVNFFRKRRPQ